MKFVTKFTKKIAEKSVALTVIGAMLAGGAVTAQAMPEGMTMNAEKQAQMQAHRAEMRTQMQANIASLGLDQAQQSAFDSIKQRSIAHGQSLRQQVQAGTMTRQEAIANMRSMMQNNRSEMSNMLTPDQLNQVQQFRQNMPQGMRGGMGFRR